MNHLLYSVKAFIILDSEGKRIISKYYSKDFQQQTSQQQQQQLQSQQQQQQQQQLHQPQYKFEKQVFEKSKKSTNEIMLLDGNVAVYRNNVDLFFYLVGSVEENELILFNCLNTFYDALSIILKSQIDKKNLLDCLESVMLALDELIDNGIILETDAQTIASRVAKRSNESSIDNPFSDQGVQQALQNAKELARGWLR